MTKRFRIESTTEIGENFFVTLIDENCEASLHCFTGEELERFRGGGRLQQPVRRPAHEEMGALPPVWAQRVEILTSRREML